MQLANILLVEDNVGDVAWFQAFCEEHKVCNRITVAKTYEETVDLLKGPTRFDLLVTDIKIPGNGGMAILRFIHEEMPIYEKIPVMILSGSESITDASEAEALGARVYMVKPISFEKWLKALLRFDPIYFGVMVNEAA